MALDFVRNNVSSLKSLRDELSSKDGKLVVPGGVVNLALNIVKRQYILPPHHKFMVQTLKKKGLLEDSILLVGAPKSGNTWTRFVIYNYFNILLNDADETLTYEQLNAIQGHSFNEDTITFNAFFPGFPIFFRTHDFYCKIFSHFSKVIFIYRNPLDVLISRYHVESQRTNHTNILVDIDQFVSKFLIAWIFHYKSIINKCDMVLCYEKMREDPYREFSHLFAQLGIDAQEEILRKSITLSRFENIKQMGRRTKQQYGNHHMYTFKGEFTRSGEVKQYAQVLKPETIEKCQAILLKNKIDIEW